MYLRTISIYQEANPPFLLFCNFKSPYLFHMFSIKFCFQFNRQGTHKTLDKDLVKELVVMPLKDRIPQDRLSSFIEFLEQTDDTSYNRITLDQWMSFYDFCKECDDLSKYDEENSAWPVLIDDFVDFATSMQM